MGWRTTKRCPARMSCVAINSRLDLIMQDLHSRTQKKIKSVFCILVFVVSLMHPALLETEGKRRVLGHSAAEWYFQGRSINIVQEKLEEIKIMQKF